MADIEQICDLIDDAVDKHKALDGMEDVITWHGHSDDAMVWSAGPPRTVAPTMFRPWTDEEIALAERSAP